MPPSFAPPSLSSCFSTLTSPSCTLSTGSTICDHILKHHNSSTFLDTGAIKQEIVDGLTTALETSYDDFRVSPLILHFLQKILHLSSLETPHLQQANTDTHNTYHEWLCNFQKGEWSRKLVSFITNPSSSLSLKYHSVKTLLNVSKTHPKSVSTMGRDWYSILKNFEVVLEKEGGFVPGGKEFDDDNEAPDDDENDDEGNPTPTPIDSVKNFTYPTSTPSSTNFPKILPMVVPFSSIRVDLENLLKTSKEAYNPKRAHEFLPSNYFPSNPPSFVWSSGLPIVSQIRELTKFYITNPEALLDPSFILNTDPTPNSLLPTALMYIIQSIPTSLSPHISATLTSKTSYISNLLTYLKTGLKTSPFLLPLTYDWSDVIEFRLKDVITQINDWKNTPTNGVETSVKSFEWSLDRANFLKIVCESTEEYCCGELVIGELYECTTSSNLSAVIILLSVFEVESLKCGANEVNVLFDKLNSKIELMIESRCESIVREWFRELESRIFETNDEVQQLDRATPLKSKSSDSTNSINYIRDEIRFTPGVMIKRRSKIDSVFSSPLTTLNIQNSSTNVKQLKLEPKVPVEWRIGVSLGCSDMNLKVDGVEEYRSPLKTNKGQAKEVSFPQDAVIVNLTDIYGGAEIRLKSRCGLIPRVDVLVGEESVTCYNLKDEQRFEIQFESTIIDPKLLICVNDTSSNPITQYCNTYTLPFDNNLKPCLSTSWCENGDTKTFRQFWGEMNWRYKVRVERVEGIDEAEDERVKRAKVEFRGGGALEIVGWGLEINEKRRLFALQTTSGPSSYIEFRSGRASTLTKLKIREGGESDLIQWLTKGEWKKGNGEVFTEEVGGMDDAFRSSF